MIFFIIQLLLTFSLLLIFLVVYLTIDTLGFGLIPTIVIAIPVTYIVILFLLALAHKLSRLAMRSKEGEITGLGLILWTIQATSLDIALTLTRKLFIHSPVPDFIYQLFGFKRRKGVSILTTLWDPDLIDVGENSLIGTGAIVSGHHIRSQKMYRKRISIGKNVTIGAYCVILPGTIIGDNTTVAMGSTVPANWKLDPNCLYGGVPVKKLKTFEE